MVNTDENVSWDVYLEVSNDKQDKTSRNRDIQRSCRN